MSVSTEGASLLAGPAELVVVTLVVAVVVVDVAGITDDVAVSVRLLEKAVVAGSAAGSLPAVVLSGVDGRKC